MFQIRRFCSNQVRHNHRKQRQKLLLSGLFVLDLSSVLAGPSVSQFLAELGANVVKVNIIFERSILTFLEAIDNFIIIINQQRACTGRKC